MKRTALLLLALAAAATANATNAVSLGYSDQGTTIGSGSDSCPGGGWLLANHDGSFENGYAWQYGGTVPPNHGMFGEGIDGINWGISGHPTSVLGMIAGVVLSNVPIWPTCAENDVAMQVTVWGEFTVGYWGNWPGERAAYFCAADLNGPGGHPWTYIAPGIGYPTGWQDPSILWGPTRAMGCGAWMNAPAPVETRSWGFVKALFE